MGSGGPPEQLVGALVAGPSLVSSVEWHERIDSTSRRAREAAEAGAAPGLLVLADEQTAGRGRRGRSWAAPPGTGLLLSLMLREPAGPNPGVLPLAVGVALAEAAAAHVGDAQVALKWPNDLLAARPGATWAKAAGVLVEAVGDAVVVGAGVNVDWRATERPPEAEQAVSLAEVAGRDVDRWRLLAAFCGVLTNRLADRRERPEKLLAAYCDRCATLGQAVAAELPGDRRLTGRAVSVADDGALVVDDGHARHLVHAADVVHVRPAGP